MLPGKPFFQDTQSDSGNLFGCQLLSDKIMGNPKDNLLGKKSIKSKLFKH
ncbi:MAG: hypothetical protein [Olavius algarvensis Gamma 1 endosymbiont]|nr:MAG: hypothetical protein [Olavius algarvensis Gamma 1 endosymbiont]